MPFDQERCYSGPLGSRSLIQLYPGDLGLGRRSFNSWTLFTLQPGQFPSTFGDPRLASQGGYDPTWQQSYTNLLHPPLYQDNLKAYVKSLGQLASSSRTATARRGCET